MTATTSDNTGTAPKKGFLSTLFAAELLAISAMTGVAMSCVNLMLPPSVGYDTMRDIFRGLPGVLAGMALSAALVFGSVSGAYSGKAAASSAAPLPSPPPVAVLR